MTLRKPSFWIPVQSRDNNFSGTRERPNELPARVQAIKHIHPEHIARANMSSSSNKRKYCEHCKEFVSLRTFRQHVDLFFNKKENKWEIYGQSSEEENTDSDTSLGNNGEDDSVDYEANSSSEDQNPQGI